MHNLPLTDQRNPYLRADSLTELLSWHDVDFVRCAYVTILGRQPDRHGEAYYTDRIRRGRSKLEVLLQLRRSAEGRRHDPGIAGLDRALRRTAWQRKAGIGWLFRLVWPQEESVESGSSQFRATMNALAASNAAIRDLAEKLRHADRPAGGQDVAQDSTAEAQHHRPPLILPTPSELAHLRPKSPLTQYFVRNFP